MKKIFKRAQVAVILAVGAVLASTATASAAGTEELTKGAEAATGGATADINTIFATVANMLVFIVGVAAVIMIIIGAIKYVTANGDQSNITSAKNTILYSIVGLILAIAAGAIVNFVIAQFGTV